jgi:hypothetical protein|tara:strand:- start:24 stop:260 length:237 start_codon:yes stop_codon:yes gene_type:complete
MAQNSMGLGPIQVNQPSSVRPANQPNEQQMLAQALRGNRGMPQQQLSEEEKMMIMQLMQQGMTQEQAMQQVMSMKSVG